MTLSKPRVIMLCTLDTKAEEAAYLRSILEQQGVDVVHLDTSIRETIGGAEISPDDVAAAAGTTMDAVRALKHEGKSQAVMTDGAVKIAHAADTQAPIAGILAIGGSMGTTIGTAVMRSFPYGLPKVMISTMASGFTAPFVGASDIHMANAVCDISGLNSIARDVYRNAALSVAAMAHGYGKATPDNRPLVLMGTLGTTERAAKRIRTQLEAHGFEVMVFHSSGGGGQTLDQIVRERPVAAVVDLSLVEMNDFLHGGICSAGPDRSKAAVERGVPVVFAPGNCDFLIAGPKEDAEVRFPGRLYHFHNAAVTAVRTNMGDLRVLADHLAGIVAGAKGPVSLFIPLKGFSNHDSPDGHLQDLTIPPQFASYAQQVMPGHMPVVVMDAHINDPEFADAIVAQVVAQTGGQA